MVKLNGQIKLDKFTNLTACIKFQAVSFIAAVIHPDISGNWRKNRQNELEFHARTESVAN